MSDQHPDPTDELLRRRLRAELPRYTAPARLRVAIVEALEPRPRRLAWLPPLAAAAATALVLVLAVIPMLPPSTPTDPLPGLVRAAVDEQSRAAMSGERRAEAITAALPRISRESGIGLTSVFAGDEQLRFVGAEPVVLARAPGLVLHYRDREGRLVSYVALRAAVKLPDRGRVQIDRFKPALMRDEGHAAWVWRHKEIACFLVSPLAAESELERFKDYFVRVRTGTEPYLLN